MQMVQKYQAEFLMMRQLYLHSPSVKLYPVGVIFLSATEWTCTWHIAGVCWYLLPCGYTTCQSSAIFSKGRTGLSFPVMQFFFFFLNECVHSMSLGFPGGTSSKEPTKAGDLEDVGSIPGSGRFLGGGIATHSSSLAWRISGTEEPGRLQSIGSQT